MQSASPSPRFELALIPGRWWGRTRASVTGTVIWSAVITALLTFVVGRSTATAGWVDGLDVVPLVALGGALLMGVLAVAPVPWPFALGAGFVAGPAVAAVAAWPTVHATHPFDALSINLLGAWWSRIADGNAAADPSFYLYLICLLMWVTGGWLSWCVLRWRKPMLGLVPGAAAFATNLLNAPTDQNGYTLEVLVLTLALLLWTNYTSSIASAARARVKLTGDARWDFWESGLVAMAALIVLAIMLPPLSTGDKTAGMQNSVFSSWAGLQQRLGRLTSTGVGPGGSTTTGFSTEVSLGTGLKRSAAIVFTYTYTPSSGPIYFRGVNVTQTSNGEWRYGGGSQLQTTIPQDTIPPYQEDYLKLALTPFTINMISPPAGNSDILFYPGTLYRSDRDSLAYESVSPSNPGFLSGDDPLDTIDRLSNANPPLSTGTYKVTVEYSTATEDDLRKAGTNYPAWLASYSSLPTTGYRTRDALARIKEKAVEVTKAAGAVTPYDKAKAIERYLRGAEFTYTLNPKTAPAGVDPIDYFLFTSKEGFCQYFATAMGDMLRSLGIPTRLVNGFGPGLFDTRVHAYVVRDEDAHTWVESYFPGYGWITFEPTNDGLYSAFTPGSGAASSCLRDSSCDTTSTSPGSVVDPTPKTGPGAGVQSNSTIGGGTPFAFKAPDAGTLTKIVGVLLALLLLAFGGAARYLRPRTVTNVWKRTLVLARLAGAERRLGETPLELGRRLAHAFPEASQPVSSLADGFVVSAYAPPDLAEAARSSVMEAWTALRPLLLRRVASRLRRSRA